MISKKEALESLDNEIKSMEKCKLPQVKAGLIQAREVVNNIQAVDAVPVVHGKWIDTQPEYHNGYYRNAHVCSNCHDYYTTEYDDLYFCPRCGARMDGE